MKTITDRASWDARAWIGQPYSVPMSERTHFLVHYWGSGSPRNKSGAALAREVEAVHLANGWSGIGYNFVVGQDGGILEARGWGLVGAHCPGKNRTGIGVFVAVGGDDEPTDAAKASVVWLYAESQRRAGHSLTRGVHGDYYATACAGRILTPWVHAGMPTDGTVVVKPKPTSKPKPKPKGLVVDGLLGPATYRALQKAVGSPADGIWGPATRRALQRHLGVTVDGIVGRNTNRALQRKVGSPADGIWGRNTTKALQRALNKGTF